MRESGNGDDAGVLVMDSPFPVVASHALNFLSSSSSLLTQWRSFLLHASMRTGCGARVLNCMKMMTMLSVRMAK